MTEIGFEKRRRRAHFVERFALDPADDDLGIGWANKDLANKQADGQSGN